MWLRNGTHSGYRCLNRMREIIPNKLWLGHAADVRNVDAVMQAGILAVVDLAIEQVMTTFPRSIAYCRFPIIDGQQCSQGGLRVAIESLVAMLKAEIPTLVCCGAGMSRSPAVAAAAISILHGGSSDDRLREITMGHPHDVSPTLWREVREICAAMQNKH